MLEYMHPQFNVNIENEHTLEDKQFFKLHKALEEKLHEHTKVALVTLCDTPYDY